MKECTIALPVEDTDGKELVDVHTDMIEEIVRRFGNCKAVSAVQFYRNPANDKFEDKDVLEYKFAIPVDCDVNTDSYIHGLAVKYGGLCKAKYIYIVNALGTANYIDV